MAYRIDENNVTALRRKFRDGVLTEKDFNAARIQHGHEIRDAYHWGAFDQWVCSNGYPNQAPNPHRFYHLKYVEPLGRSWMDDEVHVMD